MYKMLNLWRSNFLLPFTCIYTFHIIYGKVLFDMRTAVAQWLRCWATNRTVASSIPVGVSGLFIDIKSFRSHYGPGIDSASNRNEYKEYFLGKGGRCVRLTTYHYPVPLSRNLGVLTSWNPLGHSRSVTRLLYYFLLFDIKLAFDCAWFHASAAR